MTYQEICDILTDAGIENARTEALLLIGFATKKSRAAVLASPEYDYTENDLFSAIDKRCSHYPLQYILGEWDFYRESYEINESCLIPRSDTEILVDYAVKNLPEGARFADLCTGSGCIAVSTLANTNGTTAIAADKFEETLNVAKRNAEKNGVSSRFTGMLCDVLLDSPFENEEFDAILSNPPYIRSVVVDTLEEELFFEPRAALDGGSDGLIFYRHIVKEYGRNLKNNGFFAFEIGFDQEDDIKKIAKQFMYECEVFTDLSGNPRLAVLKKQDRR